MLERGREWKRERKVWSEGRRKVGRRGGESERTESERERWRDERERAGETVVGKERKHISTSRYREKHETPVRGKQRGGAI